MYSEIATKAPGGFGLGQFSLEAPADNDANNAIVNGKYTMYASTQNGLGIDAILDVDVRSFNQTVQTATQYMTGCKCQRHQVDGVWQDWEWINPRMVIGTEYKTVERWNTHPVYVILLNLGNAPANTVKIIEHGIAGMEWIVDYFVFMGSEALPFQSDSQLVCEVLGVNRQTVRIKSTYDWSTLHNMYCWIKYTKTT